MKSFPLSRKDLEDFFGANAKKISRLAHVKVANSPGHESISVENREGTDSRSGTNARLMWGARTDVGLVREHNEDSFLVQPPLFAVCDGMGGHAAGEVASFIAVETIGKQAPHCANDVLLGASVEAANTEIINQAAQGHGKPGMGCTASCALIENNKIAIAHVGDSRIYLLHNGSLVRLTHDHSFVEELVDAGEITADEARVHPSRSIITRALGSDPDMYADHFKLDINTGDRIIICSDGLSSMIEDAKIESLAVSAVHPQSCADNLVAAALEAGGLDNVTVVVVDIKDDGAPQKSKHMHMRRLYVTGACALLSLIMCLIMGLMVVSTSWYLGINDKTVGIYQGVNNSIFGIQLSHLSGSTSVEVKDLPLTTQKDLEGGVRVGSEQEARSVVENYRDQIDAEKSAAAIAEQRASEGTSAGSKTPEADDETDNESTQDTNSKSSTTTSEVNK